MKSNQEIVHYLSKIKIAQFIAIYEAGPDGLELPPYKGATFRGSFGHVFREVACTCRHGERGFASKHLDHCAYGYIFETAPLDGAEVLVNNESIPRPFLLEPPNDMRTYYAPGERFTLGFTLFGKGIEYLPYFIYVLDVMGLQGFGKGRKHAKLRQVFTIDKHGDWLKSIYHANERLIRNDFSPITGEDIFNSKMESDPQTCHIHFISPARLKYEGEFVSMPEFHMILRSACRRITALLYFHQDELKLEFDFYRFFQQAEQEITCINANVEWTSWERYSNRQKQRLKIGGIVGKAIYKGDFKPYLPWLKLAEWCNIGKNPVFGLGSVKVIFK